MTQRTSPRASDSEPTHSEQFITMASSSQRRQRLAQPDGYGKNIGDCGDTVEIFLQIVNDKIKALSLSFIAP